MRNGDYVTLLTRDTEGIYAFARVNDEDEVIVVINNSGEDYVFDSDDLDEMLLISSFNSIFALFSISSLSRFIVVSFYFIKLSTSYPPNVDKGKQNFNIF